MTQPIEKAIQIIKFFEGCNLLAYQFPGESWFTIGWGCTGSWVREGLRISQPEADARLLEAIARKQELMRQTIRTPLDPNAYQGILSFVYNAREDKYRESGFLSRLNEGNLDTALERLLLWEKSERGVELGLRRRRRAEWLLARSGRVCLDRNTLDDWEAVQRMAIKSAPEPIATTIIGDSDTLIVKSPTWLKPRCQQAAKINEENARTGDALPENQCHWLTEATHLKVASWTQEHNHYRVTLEQPYFNRRDWWVYAGHTEWFKEPQPRVTIVQHTAPKPTDLTSRIIAYAKSKNYRLFTGADEVNIIYVEGADENGTPNADIANVWNDRRLVICWVSDRPVIVLNATATTEPGSYFTQNPMNPLGAARIQFGQYQAWRMGWHKPGHESLIQAGAITVCRDFNEDGLRVGDYLNTGYFGVNQHHGNDSPVHDIGRWSAGCLVGRQKEAHRKFLALCKKDPKYRQDEAYLFFTAVLPGDALAKS